MHAFIYTDDMNFVIIPEYRKFKYVKKKLLNEIYVEWYLYELYEVSEKGL